MLPSRRRKATKVHAIANSSTPIKPAQLEGAMADVVDVNHDHSYISIVYSDDESINNDNLNMDISGTENNVVVNSKEEPYLFILLKLLLLLLTFLYTGQITSMIVVTKKAIERNLNFIKNLCDMVKILNAQVQSLLDENKKLRKELDNLKTAESRCRCKLPIFEQLLKIEKYVKFYTSIQSMNIFMKLHVFIYPYVRQLWRGPKCTSTKIKRKFKQPIPKRMGPGRKLNSIDQFLLMLMKIRLNVPSHDLANRFNISDSSCCSIFASWLKASAMVMKSFVYMPDQGSINATKPPRFSAINNLNSIIDCSEIFTETPKDHRLQRLLWFSYKHHNTLKFLIGVAPNSMIVFLSQAYCGSISDKEITIQRNYFDQIEPYCSIMADKGFIISKECTARRLNLIIPPGRRGHAQMQTSNILKTKVVAQLRILVEQVIRRLKCFRILSQELPISLINHIDDILIICAALVNMKKPIMK